MQPSHLYSELKAASLLVLFLVFLFIDALATIAATIIMAAVMWCADASIQGPNRAVFCYVASLMVCTVCCFCSDPLPLVLVPILAGVLTWAFHRLSRAVKRQSPKKPPKEPEILDAETVDEPIDVPYRVLKTTQSMYPPVKR